MPFTAGDLKRHKVGQITANETTEVTIIVPNLQADSIVIAINNTPAGSSGIPYITTKNTTTETVGFKSLTGDTSVYDVYAWI